MKHRDVFSDLALSLENTPVFTGFLGTLDGAGRATAKLDTLVPVPVVLGLTLHFAYGLHGPWNFASNAVAVRFSPSVVRPPANGRHGRPRRGAAAGTTAKLAAAVASAVSPYVFMILRPALRFLTGPRPPRAFAARFFAAVILPPLLFFTILK